MTAQSNQTRLIETDLPARLDRLPWSRFHTLLVFALGITWLLDGSPYFSVTRTELPAWPFDHSFYLLINLAVGGRWASGEPALPATMLVDWVRVTEL